MAADDLLTGRMNVAISATRARVRQGRHEAGTLFDIRRLDAGKLLLPTGQICVTDAYGAGALPPLNRIVAQGAYPVELVIAQLPARLRFGGERCIFIVVTFDAGAIASWTPVTAVSPAEPNFMDAHPNRFVQEGTTALFSPEAGAVHYAHLREQFDQQLEAIRKQSKRFGTNDWLNYRPGQDPENVILCEGGFGDGDVECFAALTPAGRMARLVLDYQIAEPVK